MSTEDQDALADEWAAQLDADDDADAKKAEPEKKAEPVKEAAKGSKDENDEDLADEWAAALATDEQKTTQKEWDQAASAKPTDATFKDMTDISRQPKADGAKRDLDFILDIPLDVSAELGRTRLLISELLQLGQGSVVELNKLAGEPLEVYVNGKLVARGEPVVINEKFGVRLTDIISPLERVRQLG